MDELNDDRHRGDTRGGHTLGKRKASEQWELRCRPGGTGATEHTVFGVPVGPGVVVTGVREQLRGETFWADLDRERSVARGHEALRNKRAHDERQQHDAGDQRACGFMGEAESHRSARARAPQVRATSQLPSACVRLRVRGELHRSPKSRQTQGLSLRGAHRDLSARGAGS